jgi:putative ABC transport system permease protein
MAGSNPPDQVHEGRAMNSQGWSIGLWLGLKEIGSNLRRSVLSLISICLGIATVLMLNSLTGGAKRQSIEQMNRMGGVNVVTVESVSADTPEEEAAFARSGGLTFDEMQTFIQSAECCDVLLPEGSARGLAMNGPKGPKSGHAMAVSWPYFGQSNVPVEQHIEAPNRLESKWERGEALCFLGDRLAVDLFGSAQAALGKTIEYGNVRLTVAGLVISESRLDWRRRMCYYPYWIYQRHFAPNRANIGSLKVRLKSGVAPDQAVREITSFLLRQHRGVKDFGIETAEEQIEESSKASEAMSMLGWAIALMAIGVGGVGIFNLMLATVSSRLREIGVRKALGATQASVLAQFLAESVTVAGMGTLIGLVLGGAPTWFLGDLLPVKPTLNWTDYGIALLLGWGTGLFAGIYPALKAARMSPVEALRG